jgi:LuxR family maltose regulon positive regulatory protein
VAISRAALGLGSVAQLREDALLGEELESGEARLEEAANLSAFELADVHALSKAQLAMVAAEREDWEAARHLSQQARIEVDSTPLRDYVWMAVIYAVSGVSLAYWHRPAEARRDAVRATKLLASLSGLAPWMSAEGWILVSQTHLLLGDVAAARETLRTARRHLARVPDAPVLRAHFDRAYEDAAARSSHVAGPPLTAAEIRVVQYLPTHFSFREIASRLHVSRNTVKTQVISAYRKLGVSTRTEAVETARALALIGSIEEEVGTVGLADGTFD